jgi:hypothetical protein
MPQTVQAAQLQSSARSHRIEARSKAKAQQQGEGATMSEPIKVFWQPH